MVQEICADIKKLDYAKTHLQSSITALKRLQMLITAVGQLEVNISDMPLFCKYAKMKYENYKICIEKLIIIIKILYHIDFSKRVSIS